MLCACTSPDTELPEDAVVSTSICADTYLLALPEVEPRLAALSWQSRSALSDAPDRLRALPQADEDPERLRRWQGAMIVGSAGTPDIMLNWGEDFEVVWKNFAALSVALDVEDPSSTLRARLEALPDLETSPRVLYLDRSGASAGSGTFVDAAIRAAGGRNIVTTPGWQSLEAEALLGMQPDVIVTSFMDSNYVGVTDRAMRQDALAEYIESVPKIDLPGGLWPCAGPGLVEAAERLSAAFAAL